MFLVSSCRGLTMHQFERPPLVVLDLGCGGGFWSIEAAKQWTVGPRTSFGGDTTADTSTLGAVQHHRRL